MADERFAGEMQSREKETYSSVVTKTLINLGYEATKSGFTKNYEIAVLDFWTNVPTSEKSKNIPARFNGMTLFAEIKYSKETTWNQMFQAILDKYPLPKTNDSAEAEDPRHALRTFAIKQLSIDMFDEIQILRKKHEKSATKKETGDEVFDDWAPGA